MYYYMSMINEKNDIINDTPKKTDDMVYKF